MKVKFTNKWLEALKAPAAGKQAFYWDTVQPGLGVRVTYPTAKNPLGDRSYVVQPFRGPMAGTRRTLGKCAHYSIETAREMARATMSNLAQGNDVLEVKRIEVAREEITLQRVFDEYLAARQLKKRSQYDYRRLMNTYLAAWRERALISITKNECATLHGEIGEHSKAQANYAMRLLRALFNFAIAKYEKNEATGESVFPFNPVTRGLGKKKQKQWYRITRRQTHVKADDLAAWYKAVTELESDANNGAPEVIRDYLLMIMFTGLRRGETERIRKADIDFKARVLYIPAEGDDEDKDGGNKAHRYLGLPMTAYHLAILRRRVDATDTEYVFPGTGEHGYLIEPKKQVAKIIEASKVRFTLQDLRRTFATVAESLDLSEYVLKRLLNHATDDSDVTGGYVVKNVERLREPMERVTAKLLEYAGVPNAGKVVQLRKRAKAAA